MKIDGDKVLKVLALFDDEDICYIHSDNLDNEVKNKVVDKPKIKVKENKNDRCRK